MPFKALMTDYSKLLSVAQASLELGWPDPWLGAVQHAVTVGADQGEVGQSCCGGPGPGEGQDVVCLDEPFAERAVGSGEVEAVYLARKRSLPGQGGCLFAFDELAVSFAYPVQAGRQSAFAGFHVVFPGVPGRKAAARMRLETTWASDVVTWVYRVVELMCA